MTAEIERRSQLLLNASGHVRRVTAARDAVEQNRKLVTAKTGNHIDVANAAFQTPRHRNQQLIPDRVTQTVVHVLKSIEIEEEHRELIVFMVLRSFDHEFQILNKQ